ncbi:hypothetical protein BGX27_006357 [Mortierella sp. AM989]|nr:hypothetical protein BGX27_006357 [Mortierella sp. AM989]
MSLTQASIEKILQYLDPYLETLQTGFATSTRPNEATLSIAQKRQKIEATLTKDPGIFLTKWGSVILYPRPTSSPNASTESYPNGESTLEPVKSSLGPKDILDLFVPLAADYEVKYQLTKLYQQLQQLYERASFEAGKHHSNDMDVEQGEVINEDRKLDPDQNDLFSRSVVSQSTRRNRRLNYLLRHLAPPSTSDSIAMASASNTGGMGTRATSRSGASDISGSGKSNIDNRGQGSQQHPALASILSISGSMSNLSFSESTYFSDAEMAARAPELYQQYIGRFMDGDDEDEDDGDSSDTVESDNSEEDADDEGDGNRRHRRQKPVPKPFDKDVSLVDRILWNVDHPTMTQQRQEHERQNQQSNRMEAYETPIPQQQQQWRGNSQLNTVPTLFPTKGSSGAAPEKQDSESEFEEEFDTESEVDDTDMTEEPNKQLDDRKGPLKGVIDNDDELLTAMSITPPIPPDPVPGIVSSAFASAAMTLEQPEERGLFAKVDYGGDLDSDEDKELDPATANRKEDQEALRREFVLIMKQRFLDGRDYGFDYSTVDFDENLDDLEQENHDGEDKWFDSEEEGGIGSSSRAEQAARAKSVLSSKTAFDERVQAWENGAQNGSGDYDY